MNTSAIKSVFSEIVPIEEAWDDFEQYFSLRTLMKNEILWNVGDHCKHLVFINSGVVRNYRTTDSREVTHHLFFENNLFCDDYSFISQQPCLGTYDALEKTELIVIPRAALYLMYDKYPSFERLGRMVVESKYIELLQLQQN
jgi:hypothetical protein